MAAFFGFVHSCARVAERHLGHQSSECTRIGEAAREDRAFLGFEESGKTSSLFGLRIRISGGAVGLRS